MTKLIEIELLKGSILLKALGGDILFGIPPETVKQLFLTPESPKPRVIVLPDLFFHNGNSQVAVEFLLYHFLFISGDFFKFNKRLQIVGTKEQCNRVKEILRITLLGPTRQEMKSFGKMIGGKSTTKPICDFLIKEATHFALKDQNDRVYQVEDFVKFQYFDHDGKATICYDGGHQTKVVKTGENLFEVNGKQTIDLNFKGVQEPPFKIVTQQEVMEPTCLGFKVLGASSGFDPGNPCSGLFLWIQGKIWLVDSPPYVNDLLASLGICPEQIEGVILTHIHDDHFAVPSVFNKGKKMKIITTVEIFYSFLVKYSAVMDMSLKELKDYFDFMPIKPTFPIEFAGAKIEAHYTCHSIPTIGITVTITNSNGEKSKLVIGGDNISQTEIHQLFEKGIINANRKQNLLNIFSAIEDPETLAVILDCGNVPLHGVESDFVELLETHAKHRDKIFITHNNTEKLPPKISDRVLQSGQYVDLVPGNHEIFDFMSIHDALEPLNLNNDWLQTFLQSGIIVRRPAGTTIISEGENADNFYIVLSGMLNVLVGNGELKKVAVCKAGDLVGEMAVVEDKKRNATIVSHSPVKLFEIPGQLLAQLMSKQPKLRLKLEDMWGIRSFLQSVEIFSEVPLKLINQISSRVVSNVYPPNTIIIHEGSASKDCYVIKEGRVGVFIGGKLIAELGQGQLIGEMAALGFSSNRTATIKALDETSLVCFKQNQFRKLHEVPSFRFKIRFILIERGVQPQ